jgi:hypothetical protein
VQLTTRAGISVDSAPGTSAARTHQVAIKAEVEKRVGRKPVSKEAGSGSKR